MKKIKSLLFLLLLLNQSGYSQNKRLVFSDSIKHKSADHVIRWLDLKENNKLSDSVYAYHIIMYRSGKNTWIKYCGSRVAIIERPNDSGYRKAIDPEGAAMIPYFKEIDSVFRESYSMKEDLNKATNFTRQLERGPYSRSKTDLVFDIIFLLTVPMSGLIIYKQLQPLKLKKQQFKDTASHKHKTSISISENNKPADGDLEIKPEIVTAVSRRLEKFEQSNKFLDKDFNLNKMAEFVNSNTRYTSRIILYTQKKKYIEYIDDLRINYILGRLQADPKYRNYTIKALAEEGGYRSTQKFGAAFFRSTGLAPAYFIKELKRQSA